MDLAIWSDTVCKPLPKSEATALTQTFPITVLLPGSVSETDGATESTIHAFEISPV
jgi:hypothetical protein